MSYVINKSSLAIEQTNNQNNYPENAYRKMPEDWTPPKETKYLKWNTELTDLEEMTAEEKTALDLDEAIKVKEVKIVEYKEETVTRLRKKELDDDTILQDNITSLNN